MTDEQQTPEPDDRWIRAVVQGAGEPPSPPLEPMWEGIRGRTHRREAVAGPLRMTRVASLRPMGTGGFASVLRLALPMAAALVVGFGLGRWVGAPAMIPAGTDRAHAVRPVGSQGEAAPVGSARAALNDATARVLANRHIAEAGALLTLVSGESAPALPPAELRSWASELAAQARFLGGLAAVERDSRRLIRDVELIMVQLAGLPPAEVWEPEMEEMEFSLIRAGMDRTQVLERIDRTLPVVNQDSKEDR